MAEAIVEHSEKSQGVCPVLVLKSDADRATGEEARKEYDNENEG